MTAELLATVLDPDGRSGELDEGRWAHITQGHPELRQHLQAVLDTVRAPSRRLPGRSASEKRLYGEKIGPSRWLKVVVRYEATGRGWIVTAFARRSLP